MKHPEFSDEHYDNRKEGGAYCGNELVTPTAVLAEDPKGPNGELLTDAAWERGWFAAIDHASTRCDVTPEERVNNVSALVKGAIDFGISRERVEEHLRESGKTAT